MVASVETFGMVMLNAALRSGLAACTVVNPSRMLNSPPSARMVPIRVFRLVACMAVPRGRRATTTDKLPEPQDVGEPRSKKSGHRLEGVLNDCIFVFASSPGIGYHAGPPRTGIARR